MNYHRIIAAALLCLISSVSPAQSPADGLTIVSVNGSFQTHLVDLDGNIVRTYNFDHAAGRSTYLLEDESVLQPIFDVNGQFPFGGAGGRIQRVDVSDNVIWDILYSDADRQQHHDIEAMPNGNVLLIAWERHTAAEAEALGKTNLAGAEMWPTVVVEIEPSGPTSGNVVWEWRLWDHLIQDTDPLKPGYGVVADHPELLDINVGTASNGSWDHANSIDFDPVRDEIVMSCHRLNEIIVIDHSTTTAEAASHSGGNRGNGGDILYRWGNPANYGAPGSQRLHGVHGANFIDAELPGEGNILYYNNGNRTGELNDYSSAEELARPIDGNGDYILVPGQAYGPPVPTWSYDDPGTLFSQRFGSAVRMPNGNTLISEGLGGRLLEVTSNGTLVWEYFASNDVFSTRRYFLGGVVPVLVQSADATWEGDHVRLRWVLSGVEAQMEFVLWRDDGDGYSPMRNVIIGRIGGEYEFRDYVETRGKSVRYKIDIRSSGELVATVERSIALPGASFALSKISPNPFNPSTSISFDLGVAGPVRLEIFDIRGRSIATLIDEVRDVGSYSTRWDGSDANGNPAASGAYFFRLIQSGKTMTRKAVLLK